jgi:hypothetical protein
MYKFDWSYKNWIKEKQKHQFHWAEPQKHFFGQHRNLWWQSSDHAGFPIIQHTQSAEFNEANRVVHAAQKEGTLTMKKNSFIEKLIDDLQSYWLQ